MSVEMKVDIKIVLVGMIVALLLLNRYAIRQKDLVAYNHGLEKSIVTWKERAERIPLVSELQISLRDAGYYHKRIDEIIGDGFIQAMDRYHCDRFATIAFERQKNVWEGGK